MLSWLRLIPCLAVFLAAVLSACGGGGNEPNGGGNNGSSPPTTPPAAKQFEISIPSVAGVSVESSSIAVLENSSAAIKVTLLDGYSDLTVSGCGGTPLATVSSGTFDYQTGVITASCILSVTAKPLIHISLTAKGGQISRAGEFWPVGDISVREGTIVRLEYGPDEAHTFPKSVSFKACGNIILGKWDGYIDNGYVSFSAANSCAIDIDFPLHDINNNGIPDKGEAVPRLFTIGASTNVIWEAEVGNYPIKFQAYITGIDRPLYLSTLRAAPADGGPNVFSDSLLHDDGINGDEIAGDGVYTAEVVISRDAITTPNIIPGVRVVDVFPRYFADDGTRQSLEANTLQSFSISIIDPNKVPLTRATQIAPGVFAGQRFLSKQTFSNQRSQFSLGSFISRYISSPVNFILDISLDINTAESYYSNGAFGSSLSHDDIAGIGWPMPNRKSMPEFPPEAMGIVYLGPYFNARFAALNHEIGHTWGFYLCDPALPLCGFQGAHPSTSTEASAMTYGIKLRSVGILGSGGYYEIVSTDQEYYSWLDLRNMGLALEEEIPNFSYLIPGAKGVFEYDLSQVASTTWEDIVRVYGRRIPSFEPSKSYTWGAVAVLSARRPLTTAEASFYDHALGYWGSEDTKYCPPSNLDNQCIASFYAATKGRARMNTDIRLK